MMSAEWEVEVGKEMTTAVYEPPTISRGPQTVFIFAHGAGGNRNDRSMLAANAALRSCGLATVRFNFLYKEKGSGRPDPMPRLEECLGAVVSRARAELKAARLIIGGRSMGGRAASMLAAKGFECDGLLLLAYPLHPAGQPAKLRDAHLPSITVPVLCFNGTRDELCTRDLMERVLERTGSNWTMHWLEGADHSFHVLKSSGRNDADVLREMSEATSEWLSAMRS
jgi:uncharacterized protein